MMRALHLVLAALMVVLALAAPAPSHPKRSFKASAKGRGKLSPQRELLRTSRKFGWEIIVIEGAGDTQTLLISSTTSLEPPSPVSSTNGPAGYDDMTSTTSTTLTTIPTPYTILSSSSTTATASPTKSSEDGEVTANPEENDSEYLSPVTIGSQKLNLNLNFDTGSADLWVFSSELPTSEIGVHTAFNPSKSSSWVAYPHASWNITYGDGSSAYGTVGFDTVDVGGATVWNQAVEIATSVSESFVRDHDSDGLLGLSFSAINTVTPKSQKTFFENLQVNLTEPVFTVDLTSTDGTGGYEFGTIDATKYKGDIHYTPVDNSQGFWMINTPNFEIGGTPKACSGCTAIADTGTSLLYLADSIVETYYANVPSARFEYSQGGYVYPCGTKLPDLGIPIGDYFSTIKGADLTYMELPGSGGACFGGLQSSPSPVFQILGDVFLKSFFAVFDGGDLRLGIAEKD